MLSDELRREIDDALSDRHPESKVVLVVLASFTTVGAAAGGQLGDIGVAVTWFWMGIGVSVTYLLYKLLVALDTIGGTT